MTRTTSLNATAALRTTAGAAVLALLVGLPAAAQSVAPPAAAPTATESVVVTGSVVGQRTFDAPCSVNVVDAEALQAAGPMVNLSEALDRVPGLVVNMRNNYAQDLQIGSRGFGARASSGVRGIRLFSDGIPAAGADGQGQVSHPTLPAPLASRSCAGRSRRCTAAALAM